MRHVVHAIRRFSAGLAWLEMLICQILIVAFTLLLISNVVARYVLNSPFYFAEELAVYMLIWMAFLAICVTIARNDMIKLDLFVERLAAPIRRTITVVIELLVLAMLLAVLYASWQWVNSPAVAFEQALTLNMPKLPFLMIIPIFAGCSVIHVFSNLLSMLVMPDEEVGVT